MTQDPRGYVCTAELVRSRIKDGSLKPGLLITPIKALCEETGYSRRTVSRALKLLEREGLLGRSPGRGYYVLPPEGNHDD